MNTEERPYVICHMLTSIDGKLVTSRYSKPVGHENVNEISGSYYIMSSDFKADGYMVGRTTVQEFMFQEMFDFANHKPAEKHETFIGKRETESLYIFLDPQGRMIYTDDQCMGKNIVAILGEGVSEEYMQHLQKFGISYIFAGKDGRDLKLAMHTLKKEFGMSKILLEGGGTINGAMFKNGLVDEISLLVAPAINGRAGEQSVFDYKGEELPNEGQRLSLIESKVIENGIVYCRYKVHKD